MSKDDWRQRLKRHLEDRNLAMTVVAVDAGLAVSAVQDIYRKTPRTPSVDNFVRIALAAGVSPTWLLSGEGDRATEIAIKGFVRAGEGWVEADDPSDSITMIASPDWLALSVQGDSMFPVYRNGDVLICQQRTGVDIGRHAVGRDCAVVTADGRQLVKAVRRGRRNLYTLKSYSPLFEDIIDVSLKWAAPIILVRRGT